MALGDRVSGARMERVEVRSDRFGYGRNAWDLCYRSTGERVEGVLVGYRTLSDGYTKYDDEEGHVWVPYAWHNLAIVYFDLRRKPALVRRDSLELVKP